MLNLLVCGWVLLSFISIILKHFNNKFELFIPLNFQYILFNGFDLKTIYIFNFLRSILLSNVHNTHKQIAKFDHEFGRI